MNYAYVPFTKEAAEWLAVVFAGTSTLRRLELPYDSEQLKHALAKIDQLESATKAADIKLAAIHTALDQVRQRHDAYSRAFGALREIEGGPQLDFSEPEKSARRLVTYIEQLEVKLDSERSQMRLLMAICEGQKDTIEGLGNENKHWRVQAEALAVEKAELEHHASESEIEARNSRLEAELDGLTKKILELQAQLAESQKKQVKWEPTRSIPPGQVEAAVGAGCTIVVHDGNGYHCVIEAPTPTPTKPEPWDVFIAALPEGCSCTREEAKAAYEHLVQKAKECKEKAL